MSRYDGLIIPRSYNEYINKSDPLTLAQALQQNNVMDNAPTASSNKPAKSGGIFSANAVIMASGTTLTGVTIASGSIIRVMFTSAITGSDATTGLTLTYNGTAYPVKVGKQGALSNFVASYVDSAYKYVQAYTTLELAFDGTQFIIIGNPVALSSSDYTIYADGSNALPIFVDDISTYYDQSTYTLNINALRTAYGVGTYIICGNGTAGHGFAIVNIWKISSSYLYKILVVTTSTSILTGNNINNPTVVIGSSSYINAVTEIRKIG